MEQAKQQSTQESKQALRSFLDAAVSEYHASSEIARVLSEAGALRLLEEGPWNIVPGGFYYVLRGDSSLIAFRLPQHGVPSSGLSIAGAHTDSPGFRVKLESARQEDSTWVYSLEAYGSPIHSTWLDRELSVAGRVIFQTDSGIEAKNFRSGASVGCIPNPAIHIERQLNKGFQFNVQEHMQLLVQALQPASQEQAYNPLLATILEAAGIADASQILSIEAGLYPTQPAEFSGPEQSLLHASRIDNLVGCYAVLQAICANVPQGESGLSQIHMAAFFNNEEIGSRSWQGAGSRFLERVIDRVLDGMGISSREESARTMARSAFISVDASHAFHPSFAGKFDRAYKNPLGGGPVLKQSAAWKYSANLELEAWLRQAARQARLPIQIFRNRSDAAGGSTIGPIVAAQSDLRSIDVGIPMLSMHSARETAAPSDIENLVKLLSEFYKTWIHV